MNPPPPVFPRPSGDDATNRPSGRSSLAAVVAVIAVLIGLIIVSSILGSRTPVNVASYSYSTLLTKVASNGIRSVDINQSSGVITGVTRQGQSFTAQGPPGGLPDSDLSLLAAHHVARDYVATSSNLWVSALFWIVPVLLIIGVWVWMSRRVQGQLTGVQDWRKSQARVQVTKQSATRLADVAGYDTVKQEVREVIDFLRSPARFRLIGARVPKGILLVGPPGTGKTLLARAIAGEAGVAFLSITGSEFMELFVGIGAARVRDLFQRARSLQPAIVFVDEIDAIGRKRGTGLGGGHDEREQTLNQLLSELDGFEASEGIIVLAATNRPDVLDPALLRAGRFDRQIVVPLPTLEERRAIAGLHARNKRLGPDIDIDLLARGSPGMSGADLENVLNEAALIAVRRGATTIGERDLEDARDRVLLGLKRSALVLQPDERRAVAVHEAGHALAAALLPHADPVHKVTILPTGLALGATEQLPLVERTIHQRPELDDVLAVHLAGREAEQLVLGVSSTGAADDLTAATELAGRMVREWGMSTRLGKLSWGKRGPVFLGEDLLETREYSDATARVIDEEISALLDEQARRAHALLEAHRSGLEAIAAALVAAETLSGEQIERLIHEAEPGLLLVPSPASASADAHATSASDVLPLV